MPDLLQQASAWLEDQRTRFLTRTVVYQRPATPTALTAQVSATIGRTVFTLDNGDGVIVRTVSRDFLITAADLVLGESVTLPKRGDRIVESDAAGQSFTHEVMAPGQEPCWRYSDPYRRTLRIHTKQVNGG